MPPGKERYLYGEKRKEKEEGNGWKSYPNDPIGSIVVDLGGHNAFVEHSIGVK